MPIDKLSLFNDALRIIGERKLATLTEEREPRFRLDDVYDFGAIDFCLELVRPRFASVVDKLTVSTTSAEHSFTNVYTLPADYLVKVGVFSDSKLDEPITRYVIEGRTLATDHSEIYLRYTSTTTGADFANWTPSFARVVSTYLARQIAPRIRPDALAQIDKEFGDIVGAYQATDASEENQPRSKPVGSTLTPELLHIYNDALFLLGQPQLISISDDSNRRAVLDAAMNQGIAEFHLEDTAWHWAITTNKVTYNPSLDPSWGYRRAFNMPSDMLRLDGVFVDDYFQVPLKRYNEEDQIVFCDNDDIYLKYVSRNRLTEYTRWPAYFRKVVAADLAVHASLTLGSDPSLALAKLEERRKSAMSNDAMQAPPRRIQNGNWSKARVGSNHYRNRP